MKRIYDKILIRCRSRRAPYLLGMVSFTESCCFVIPPEVMLVPMAYAEQSKTFRFAMIATMASVAGAAVGYGMGALLWDNLSDLMFRFIPGVATHFNDVGTLYQKNAVSALFTAAFTPIPFKVFTLAAGVYADRISLGLVILIAFLGRGARYGILSALVYFFGTRAMGFIERWFSHVTIALGIVAVIIVMAMK